MNVSELRDGLQRLSDPAFKEFVRDFGGDFQDREAVVRAFVDKPALERRLSHLLSLATEEEKTVQAALAAASSAKWSTVAAGVAAAVALLALLVSIYGVLK